MKRYLSLAFLASLVCSVSVAADVPLELIGPTSLTQNTVTTTVASPGANYRNCLTEVSVSVSSNAVVRILDGGTTTFAVDVTTSTFSTVTAVTQQPLRMTWPLNDPFCASYNRPLVFTVVDTAGIALPHKINYRGYVYGSK